MFREYYNYYLSPQKDLAHKLKEVLGFVPRDLGLFKRAFYHKSMGNGETGFNNERLEYLGDSILSTIVAEYLYKKYPGKDEGFLTQMRSKIVKRKSLNLIAQKMGLDVILSQYTQGKLSVTMLGNAFEALIGALYLEYGYYGTRDYLINVIFKRYLNIRTLEDQDDNYKSKLLEWSQKEGHVIDYKVMDKKKINRRDRYTIGVMLDNQQISKAEDFNKKAAEQKASHLALQKLKIN